MKHIRLWVLVGKQWFYWNSPFPEVYKEHKLELITVRHYLVVNGAKTYRFWDSGFKSQAVLEIHIREHKE